ncbi:shikimate dehydrogenase [Intrasporangium calvum]|uniref:Shikimate dehydrogenase n=1 Tax=Intrasporangium calvum TaxID=53358 RepID=A0ABT5GCD8_9MICO|nr:shikimate dehydrogenase [Intrasporangium calvum]MDC5695939.1 shikimate dehydrogenase [Intrasporangium calvum]
MTPVRCAVWGSPIAHSLSPVLHRAAYAALGLTDWTYERREVDEGSFDEAFRALDDSWRGLSLTMPLKEAALAAADQVTDTAAETGAANTLVRSDAGWTAHNTDVHGIQVALREAGCLTPSHALLLGSGATARSAVAALAAAGTRRITFMVRDRVRPETLDQAGRAGLEVAQVSMGQWLPADVVISTVPPHVVGGLPDFPPATQTGGQVLLDVVYGSGRTPLQEAAAAAGWVIQEGTAMLLHQATEQVRLMTGRPAPLAAMRAALAAALAQRSAG